MLKMRAWAAAGTLAAGLGIHPASPPVNELSLQLPEPIGQEATATVGDDDTLLDMAVRSGVGFEALARLNPELDVWMPPVGIRVPLPTRMIPPNAPTTGLVVNVPEMRLYDYTQPGPPRIYPIAVGDSTTPSPISERRIRWKTIDPTWRVPESIRAERPWLPAEVPPGEDNPLGRYWLDLGDGYGIHGTNNLWSIGRVATHGCIRLHDSQIERLYEDVPVGTPVHIVYQTIKLGRSGQDLYLEAHPDLYELTRAPFAHALVHLLILGLLDDVDRALVERTIEEARGVPVWIGRATSS